MNNSIFEQQDLLESVSGLTSIHLVVEQELSPEYMVDKMCSIREYKNSCYGYAKMPKRPRMIRRFLSSMGIKSRVDKFECDRLVLGDEGKELLSIFGVKKTKLYRYNIEVLFKAKEKTDQTVVFVAHHDVNNINSDNFQDNTSSVVNVLSLCSHLNDIELDRNVLVVFTDCEEFGLLGAKRLCHRIKDGVFGDVKYVVNSELTGVGDLVWGENISSCDVLESKIKDIKRKSCPYNDSYAFRENDIPSICFGLLPKEEGELGMPETWRVCHSTNDLKTIANYGDMEKYVEFLKTLI